MNEANQTYKINSAIDYFSRAKETASKNTERYEDYEWVIKTLKSLLEVPELPDKWWFNRDGSYGKYYITSQIGRALTIRKVGDPREWVAALEKFLESYEWKD